MTNQRPDAWTPDIARLAGPRYRAIADALAEDIAGGRLPAGSRLPTHRDLAFRLKVTVGTVTRAYAEAERRGLIGGEVGRGTFVLGRGDSGDGGRAVSAGPLTPWLPQPVAGSPIDMSLLQPYAYGAVPAMAATLAEMAGSLDFDPLMECSPHSGLPAHRAAGAQWLARHHRLPGIAPDQVIVTNGAQNALAMACIALARAGDLVVTERLTFFGIKALTATLGLRLEGLAMDDQGLLPDAFEAACRQMAPRLLYTVPTLNNPTAAILSAERRAAIADIARRHDVTILEDDVFGFLTPDAPPPIHAIAPDITIYTTSLSKSIAAGLRLGYLVAGPRLMPRMEASSRAINYTVAPVLAELAARWIIDGSADRFALFQREEARARQVLARDILSGASCIAHPSSYQVWLNLPEPWRRETFIKEARRRGVEVTGADIFAVGRSGVPHAVRVALCMPRQRELVAQGLTILAEVLASPAEATLSIV